MKKEIKQLEAPILITLRRTHLGDAQSYGEAPSNLLFGQLVGQWSLGDGSEKERWKSNCIGNKASDKKPSCGGLLGHRRKLQGMSAYPLVVNDYLGAARRTCKRKQLRHEVLGEMQHGRLLRWKGPGQRI